MPSRVNPAAVALLAGGVSLSALVLVAYLKLRGGGSRRRDLSPQSKSGDQAAIEPTLVPEEFSPKFEPPPPPSLPEVTDPGESAAEESLSECEFHLEEEAAAETPEEAGEDVEEEDLEVLDFSPIEMSMAGMVEQSCGVNTDSSNNNNNNNNNNNESVIGDKAASSSESAAAPLTVDCCAPTAGGAASAATAADGVGGGGDRVSKWLAKNEGFCRHRQQQEQQQQHQHREDASDDSGRPSSVDTAADAASPRGAAATVAAAAAAAVGSRYQRQQHLQHRLQPSSSAAAVAAAAAAAAAGVDSDSAAASLQLPLDRSKMIRGVSPVPGDENDVIHQFLIPNKLGGSMVGTRGRNINYIRAKSGASVWISRNFFDKKTQVVNVRGPVECVKSALQVIKKRFPELDVKPINTAVPIQRNPALQPTMCQLSLPVGALVDVAVCAMCRGTTVFLQQPTHPSFHHLEKMDYTIMKHYADQVSVPALPRPVNPGAVCVAPFGSAWYRAIIADVYPEEDNVLMKYLDWGGYERMSVGCLKQIRTEMMHLPFQAVEAHLAYVSPVLAADEDPEVQLEQLSRTLHERYLSGPGRRVKCQVVYFNDVGQPCVYLYTRDGQSDAWQFLQEDLVQAGLAQWFQMPHLPPQLPQG